MTKLTPAQARLLGEAVDDGRVAETLQNHRTAAVLIRHGMAVRVDLGGWPYIEPTDFGRRWLECGGR